MEDIISFANVRCKRRHTLEAFVVYLTYAFSQLEIYEETLDALYNES
jgi:hypothetical protein